MAVNDFSNFNKTFNIVTFNCKHFKDRGPKFDFIQSLMQNNNIVMLQEHCLFSSSIDKLRKLDANIEVVGKSSMNENVVLEGRPHGGVAIIYKSNMNCQVSEVKCESVRLCGITLTLNEGTLLILNAYMPCDSGRRDDDFDQYNEVLNEVGQILHRINPVNVLFGGDLNTDLRRKTPFVASLKQFICDYDFCAGIERCNNDIQYTYIGPRSTSIIDHFLMSSSLLDSVLTYDIIDCHLFSDHVPLKMSFDYNVLILEAREREYARRIAWHKADVSHCTNYRNKLKLSLENIDMKNDVLKCRDVTCTDHVDDLCAMYHSLLDSCLSAAEECIPKSGVSTNQRKGYSYNRGNVPGWNKDIDDLKKESLMWHHTWKNCGRPHDGHVAEMHRISRARYHKAVRQVLRNADVTRMERMAQALSENRSRDLWKEVKKIKGRNNIMPCSIDGCVDNAKIADVFSEKYMNLYNSVPYRVSDMTEIYKDIVSRIQIDDENLYCVSVNEICKAVSQLKKGKSDGNEGLQSDHIIHAPHLFYVLLTAIVNSMLIHGTSPTSMVTGVMVPIPKSKSQLSCSSNYRAITLSSIIGKIVDLVILMKESKSLMSCDLQFGFKQGVSTTQCTFIVNEVVSYYNYKRSNVYVGLLDATKAFDRVNYSKLFRKLLDRNVSPLVLRLLYQMYTCQKLKVKWSNFVSDTFSVTNGVKQGGVLSPILFSVYVDDLLVELSKSGIGCHVGNNYVGCLSYADDLTLLAPTVKALQNMIDICEKYATSFDITFNGKKSVLMMFKGISCKNSDCHVVVNGNIVRKTNQALHLGHSISSDDCNSMMKYAIGQFWKQFNILLSDFGHIDPYYSCKLFKQYCCSFYGSPLWSFNSCKDVCIAWRKALRKLWRLHPQTHGDILAVISECVPLEINLYRRFSKFTENIVNSTNIIIKSISKVFLTNPLSVFTSNLQFIKKYFCSSQDCSKITFEKWCSSVLCDEFKIKVSLVKELIAVRDGQLQCSFDQESMLDILVYVCVN